MRRSCPSKSRGRRESRMPNAPAASRAVGRSTRVSPPQVQPERPGLPCANGFNGVLRALPGVHDLLVTVAGRSSPADLAPAKGCQDHTSSSVRKKRRSSREALRPSHPALNVRDDAYAPLVEAGRREDVHDFRFSESEIFSRPDRTPRTLLNRLPNPDFSRRLFCWLPSPAHGAVTQKSRN